MKLIGKRILAASLAALMALPLLASCAEEDNVPESIDTTSPAVTETTAEETTTYARENTPDSLPDNIDLKGITMNIPWWGKDAWKEEIYAEQETGDVVNDAIYQRNIMVEERLKIKMNPIKLTGDYTLYPQELSSSILAASGDYDVIPGLQANVVKLVTQGLFYNLEGAPHIDRTQPWWWNDYIDEMSIGEGVTFFLNGDISIVSLSNMSCIFFNKEMLANLGTTDEQMYQMVMDKKWNYDEYMRLITAAYRDVNGDGKADADDVYGTICATSTNPDHFTYTAGNVMNVRDKNNIPTLTVNTERYQNYMELLYKLYYETTGFRIGSDVTAKFLENKCLFLTGRFTQAKGIREMETDFGVIPMPLYGDQTEYSALVHDSSTVYCTPMNNTRIEAVCMTIEAMCAQNYRTVIPAYYEQTLKVKYQRDSMSGQIIDMIKNSAHTDFVYAYNYALNGAGLVCRKMLSGKNSNLASYWASQEAACLKAMDDLVAAFQNIKELGK